MRKGIEKLDFVDMIFFWKLFGTRLFGEFETDRDYSNYFSCFRFDGLNYQREMSLINEPCNAMKDGSMLKTVILKGMAPVMQSVNA